MTGRRSVLAGFSDDTLPAALDVGALLEPHGIDAVEFRQWLGERLGDYRASMGARERMKRDAETKALADVGAAFDAACAALDAGPGPRGDMHATLAASRLGLDWPTLAKRLRWDLAAARAIVSDARAALDGTTEKRGRRPEIARDELLRALVARLRAKMPAKDAHGLAEQILTLCRVPVPRVGSESGDRALRRAVKGQK